VWPELSAQSIPNRELLILAREPGQAPFLTTFPDQVAPLPHNVLAMFSRDGESAHYFKRKPFAAERSMHAAGSQPVSVSYLGTRIGLGICFDECYPAVMRELANDTLPDVIAIPSLDPATPYGVIQAMHGAFTPFRAAELGTPFVRSEITGYSQIVERDGMIVGELAAGREGMMVADIHLGSRHTVYRTLGDWFLYLCALSLATQGLRQVIRKRRQVIADRSRSPLETS
jgi:apolipoprotein N-acyltransferase